MRSSRMQINALKIFLGHDDIARAPLKITDGSSLELAALGGAIVFTISPRLELL